MESPEENFALSYLQEWASSNRNFFASRGIEAIYKPQNTGSGNLRFQFTDYLVDICAWNNAICLDIQIIHIPSEKVSFPTTGPCETEENFKERLDELYAFIENNSEKNH